MYGLRHRRNTREIAPHSESRKTGVNVGIGNTDQIEDRKIPCERVALVLVELPDRSEGFVGRVCQNACVVLLAVVIRPPVVIQPG